MSWAESKWIVDNLTQKTGQVPNKMRAFSAYPLDSTSIGIKFLEPADGYDADGNLVCATGGVMIRMSTEGYPASTADGELVINNTELGRYETKMFPITGLIADTTYYFTAFPYSSKGVYNVTANVANHTTAITTTGEVARVSITIDDTSEFNSVAITCVDETDTSLTASTILTVPETVTTFAIPEGHVYHIEYGVEYAYTKPEDSMYKTAVAETVTDYAVTYEHFTATINVTYPEGATITCENDGVKYTALTTTGTYTFKVHSLGEWVVTVLSESELETANRVVMVTTNGQTDDIEITFLHVYGIKKSLTSSSPAWARTDESENFGVAVAVGTTAGYSDFDNYYPWSLIKRVKLDTEDIMIKIPKFYYKRYRDDTYEYIQIANKAESGFVIHPAFNHSGVETDYIYVGAYKTSSGYKSVTGVAPLVSVSRAGFRTGSHSKGEGWWMIDVSTISAIQMLYLVEFANSNSQAMIGLGYVSGSATIKTGTTDEVVGLTGRAAGTDGTTDIKYRGIEGFWGNVGEWYDGINIYHNKSASGQYYICNTPANYADATSANHTKLSYTTPASSGVYIVKEGVDTNNSYVMLPNTVSGAATTYDCDLYYGYTSTSYAYWRVPYRSGYYSSSTYAGIFFSYSQSSVYSTTYAYVGSRLIYIPLESGGAQEVPEETPEENTEEGTIT